MQTCLCGFVALCFLEGGELAGQRRTSTRGELMKFIQQDWKLTAISHLLSSWWKCYALESFFLRIRLPCLWHVSIWYSEAYHLNSKQASLACLVKFPSPLLRASIFPPAGVQQLSWSPVELEWLASTSAKPHRWVCALTLKKSYNQLPATTSCVQVQGTPTSHPAEPPTPHHVQISDRLWSIEKGKFVTLLAHFESYMNLICQEFGDEFDSLNPWEDRRLGWDYLLYPSTPSWMEFPKVRKRRSSSNSRAWRQVEKYGEMVVFSVWKKCTPLVWNDGNEIAVDMFSSHFDFEEVGFRWHWRLVSSKFACSPEGSWQLGYRFEVRGVLDSLTVWVLERLQLKPATRHKDWIECAFCVQLICHVLWII